MDDTAVQECAGELTDVMLNFVVIWLPVRGSSGRFVVLSDGSHLARGLATIPESCALLRCESGEFEKSGEAEKRAREPAVVSCGGGAG